MATARITVEELHHHHGEVETLAGVSFVVEAGQLLAIVGPSGCGKSTLLNLIAGLDQPSAGRISIESGDDNASSRPLDRLAATALMPQRDLLLPWFDALDNASLAARNRGVDRRLARAEAAACFQRFGLAGFERKPPHQLSGGMRQRVAFLRTLLAGKPVLLLDEPFAALDSITRADMQDWLATALRSEQRTAILVTHDVEEALLLADRVLILTPRPAQIAGLLEPPPVRDRSRAERLADPVFIALRQQATELLAAGRTDAGRPTVGTGQ